MCSFCCRKRQPLEPSQAQTPATEARVNVRQLYNRRRHDCRWTDVDWAWWLHGRLRVLWRVNGWRWFGLPSNQLPASWIHRCSRGTKNGRYRPNWSWYNCSSRKSGSGKTVTAAVISNECTPDFLFYGYERVHGTVPNKFGGLAAPKCNNFIFIAE